MFDTAQPYIASFVILRRGNAIAFVLRQNTKWMDGYYGLPAGKVEKNESFSAAAIREAQEEVNVIIKPEALVPAIVVHRLSRDNGMDWVDAYFEAEKWDGEPMNAEPTVHGELAWLELDNLPDNIVPPVRFALERLAAGEHYAEYGWDDTPITS